MIETSAMERNVYFRSGSLKLSAVLRIHNGMQPGESRPAFVVLHGFGRTKNAGNVIRPTEILSALGYVTTSALDVVSRPRANAGRSAATEVEIELVDPTDLPDRMEEQSGIPDSGGSRSGSTCPPSVRAALEWPRILPSTDGGHRKQDAATPRWR